MFKINDYLATIDNRLNSPINTFYFTAKYSMQEIDAVESKNEGFWRKWKRGWVTRMTLFKIHFGQYIMWILGLFGKTDVIQENVSMEFTEEELRYSKAILERPGPEAELAV